MAEQSLMASAAFSPGVFHQDHALQLLRPIPKDFQPLSPSHGKRQNVCMQTGAPQFEDPWKISSQILDDQLFKTMQDMNKPVLIDVQDASPDLVLFSFGVAEQCTRHEKILKFLMSGSNITDGNDLNISIASDLMGFQTVAVDMHEENSLYEIGMEDSQLVIHPQKQLYAPQPLLEFVGKLSHDSSITVHPNGQVLFTGSAAEMKDLLSIVEEFNISKGLSNGSRKAMVVPYFTRRRGGHARVTAQASSPVSEPQIDVSPKSSTKTKKKKQNRNPNSDRLYKNYFYACDCLFDMYLDNTVNKTTVLSLKDSGPELTQLLSQISAGVVGTGLAVLLSVLCKTMNGRAPFLSWAKLFNVGFGFGLFWLSWSVNKLRDTIYDFSKRSARATKMNDAVVLVEKVKRNMGETFFRFAAVMLVGILSF